MVSACGAVGFRVEHTDKIMYSSTGAAPFGLGAEVLRFVYNTPPAELKRIASGIEVVTLADTLQDEHLVTCAPWADLDTNPAELNWVTLLRHAHGNLEAYRQGLTYLLDQTAFLAQPWQCDWAYVLNLDSGYLECYTGTSSAANDNDFETSRPSAPDRRLLAELPLGPLHVLPPARTHKVLQCLTDLAALHQATELPLDRVYASQSSISNTLRGLLGPATETATPGLKTQKPRIATTGFEFCELSEECVELRLNGERIWEFNHDAAGPSGLASGKELIRAIARKLNLPLTET